MERMELLYETNQMDQETYNQIPALIQRIANTLLVDLTEDNAGACMTHLVKAIMRVKNNEAIGECSEQLMAQMKSARHLFDFSLDILKPYNKQGAPLEAEAAFIAAYFVMMTEEEEE